MGIKSPTASEQTVRLVSDALIAHAYVRKKRERKNCCVNSSTSSISYSTMLRLPLLYVFLLLCHNCLALSHVISDSLGTCTLSSVGNNGDDSPNIEAALKSAACDTVVIPRDTTLNIATRLDTTRLVNKRIVRTVNNTLHTVVNSHL